MKSAPPQGGFTIVETMIVLAVMGVMTISAVLLVAGQQRKVEFYQAVQDVQSAVQQTISEVGNGYYPNSGGMRCQPNGSKTDITNGSENQGSNTGCIFLGKAVQFGVHASSGLDQYVIHSIAGLADNNGDLKQAAPTDIARGISTNSSPAFPDFSVTKNMLYGIQAVRMWYVTADGSQHPVGAVAFLSSLGSYDGTSKQLLSGSQQVNVVPVVDKTGTASLGLSSRQMADVINTSLGSSPLPSQHRGVFVCLLSGGTDQSALLNIGNDSRGASVSMQIKSTKDCT